ncbi:plasmid pRiA4b ORF-3 family protein [Sphingomonas sp. DC2300-3]|uniref:plasmid pRiA4b ORF-3 family protein n=1 Tax=unclassified Sphingomonas TaxID=196159 RepID=UPI003CFA203D
MSAETIPRLHIVLDDIEPVIWRRVDVPVTASLKVVHDIVQAAIGSANCHLWHFEAGDRRYGIPDRMWPESGMTAAKNVKLAALIDRGVRGLVHTYDMGDDWRHTITIESRPRRTRRQISALRRWGTALPPEDVGGLPGFEMFLDAMADPSHEDHDPLREWYGTPYNAEDIHEPFTRRAVTAIAIRRHAGKLTYQKSRAQ